QNDRCAISSIRLHAEVLLRLAMIRRYRHRRPKSVETHLLLKTRNAMFQLRQLRWTIQEHRGAIRHPDVSYDAVDALRIRMKFIKAEIIVRDQKDHRTGTNPDGQPYNVDRSI